MALARWQATIVDEQGNIVPNALVTVRREVSGQPLAPLYEDREGNTAISNAFNADSQGFAAFHVAGGAYQIVASSGAFSRTWRYVALGTAGEADSESLLVGLVWKGPWVTATAYVARDAVSDSGASYICILAHTSDAAKRPGSGASWTTYWNLLADKGATGSPGVAVAKVTAGARALRVLSDAQGLVLDFQSWSMAVRDYNGVLDSVGTPSDFLTCSRASMASYVDADRILKYASNNVLRRHFDRLTGACLGLLCEGSRTNIALRSEELDNAAWVKTRVNVTAGAGVAPDGATTADKLYADNTAGADHFTHQNITLTSATQYTYSVFVKAVEFSAVELGLLSTAWATTRRARFDLVAKTATITAGVVDAVAIEEWDNGWFRCMITATTSASGTGRPTIYLYNGALSFNGDGASGVLIWGQQFEVGAFASSYTPTTSASVTQAADSITALLSTVPYLATEGTLVLHGLVGTGINQTVLTLDDATANEIVRYRLHGSIDVVFSVIDGGSTQCALAGPTYVAGLTELKAAAAWRVNDFAASYNGAAVVTDSAGTLPTPTTIRIGARHNGENFFGVIRRASLFPRRVTNAELQALAT